MKTQFRPNKESEFENQAHIARKKKATAKIFSKQTKEKEVFEYGLDDASDLESYKHLLRK